MRTLKEEVAALTHEEKQSLMALCKFLSQISLSIPPYIIKYKITYHPAKSQKSMNPYNPRIVSSKNSKL
jgi:hypothetical protein